MADDETIKKPNRPGRRGPNNKSTFSQPEPGTLWIPAHQGFLGTLLSKVVPCPIVSGMETAEYYVFDSVVALPPETVLLYLGDRTIQISSWHLEDKEQYKDPSFYKELVAAVMLFNEKQVYLLYDDYNDLWRPAKYLMAAEENNLPSWTSTTETTNYQEENQKK